MFLRFLGDYNKINENSRCLISYPHTTWVQLSGPLHWKEEKWLFVQEASVETIIGELRREAVVDERMSFSGEETSGQSPTESKR